VSYSGGKGIWYKGLRSLIYYLFSWWVFHKEHIILLNRMAEEWPSLLLPQHVDLFLCATCHGTPHTLCHNYLIVMSGRGAVISRAVYFHGKIPTKLWYDMIWYDTIWYDWYDWYDIWYYMIWYIIFVNCNWVDTRWQWYSTHLHTNNT
jgi:hypothetical protein